MLHACVLKIWCDRWKKKYFRYACKWTRPERRNSAAVMVEMAHGSTCTCYVDTDTWTWCEQPSRSTSRGWSWRHQTWLPLLPASAIVPSANAVTVLPAWWCYYSITYCSLMVLLQYYVLHPTGGMQYPTGGSQCGGLVRVLTMASIYASVSHRRKWPYQLFTVGSCGVLSDYQAWMLSLPPFLWLWMWRRQGGLTLVESRE
jgi:hypothetical protein